MMDIGITQAYPLNKDGKLRGTNTGNAPTENAPVPNSSTDKDVFMTLLLAQLKNQNPLDPTNPKDFVAQFAQIKQVDATQKMQEQLQVHTQALNQLNGLFLGGQVGQQVLLRAENLPSVHLSESRGLAGRITLAGAEQNVKLTLTNAAGEATVVDLGSHPAGPFDFNVDPKTYKLPAGDYQLAVSNPNATLEVQATVSAVRLPKNGSEAIVSLMDLGDFPVTALSGLLGKASLDSLKNGDNS